MKRRPFKNILLTVISALLLMIPSITLAQTEQSSTGPPPIEQQLVREGDLAVKLVFALGVGVATDEAEAESRLAEVGIAPKSGWIADYPVTPDIAGELRHAVLAAADAGKLAMARDKALQEYDNVLVDLGLPVVPYSGETAYESAPPATESYVGPDVVNNYYYSEGPPVVTYYAPPPAYNYLYAWVPYPFWTAGFLFPGFFVLHDFHKTVFVHHHHRSFFVTNHFKDARTHRVFRIDPVKRFKGDSFIVRRGHDSRAFISGGVRDSDRRFSDRHRTRSLQDGRTISPRSQDTRVLNRSSSGSGRDTRQHFDRTRTFTPSSQGVRSFNRSSSGSGRDTRQHFDRTRTFTPSSQGVRSFNRSSSGSGRDNMQHFDRTRTFTPSSQGVRSFNRPSGSSGRDTSHFRSGGFSGQHSQSGRSFSRPSSRGGSTTIHTGGARSFSPASRGGGFSHGGRGRR